MTTSKKTRLDQLLVDRELVETRSKAKSLILAGEVLVDNACVDKPGTLIKNDALLRVKQADKYVSRGGKKLEKALTEFSLSVSGCVCVDVGASTGGFTDCLLQHGASKVYAIDVGYGQLHWKLQSDLRVTRLDRQNFRNFDLSQLSEPIDLVVVDASFISLKILLQKIVEVLSHMNSKEVKYLVALVKPQFEVGREYLAKGGIVRNVDARLQALREIITACQGAGFSQIKTCESPITGADGNVEFLLVAQFVRA